MCLPFGRDRLGQRQLGNAQRLARRGPHRLAVQSHDKAALFAGDSNRLLVEPLGQLLAQADLHFADRVGELFALLAQIKIAEYVAHENVSCRQMSVAISTAWSTTWLAPAALSASTGP